MVKVWGQGHKHSFFLAADIMHQSVVPPAPPPMGRAVTFWVPSQCQVHVSPGLVTLCKYTSMEFTYYKEQGYDAQQVPTVQAFSRAVMDEKSLS